MTGVALITFILLAVHDPLVKVQLLVWIFVMRIIMIVDVRALVLHQRRDHQGASTPTPTEMNFEAPLTTLVWLTSFVSIALTYVVSRLLIPDLGGDPTLWWKLSTVITCGTLAGRDHPGARQGVHLDELAARDARS